MSDTAVDDWEDAPAPAAPTEVSDSTPPTPDPTPRPKVPRRRPGDLESQVKEVTDAFVSGTVTLKEGEHLTPHRVGQLIKTNEGLDAPPSVGAITGVLDRWNTIGYARVNTEPKAFVDYTEAARVDGLSVLKARAKAARKAARKAIKEAEAS